MVREDVFGLFCECLIYIYTLACLPSVSPAYAPGNHEYLDVNGVSASEC